MVQRLEIFNVGRFMKCSGSWNAKAVGIDSADGFTEREHPVKMMKIELQDFSGTRIGAMMSIMQQRLKPAWLL